MHVTKNMAERKLRQPAILCQSCFRAAVCPKAICHRHTQLHLKWRPDSSHFRRCPHHIHDASPCIFACAAIHSHEPCGKLAPQPKIVVGHRILEQHACEVLGLNDLGLRRRLHQFRNLLVCRLVSSCTGARAACARPGALGTTIEPCTGLVNTLTFDGVSS